MRDVYVSSKYVFAFLIFCVLNAGLFTLIPISGIGFAFYMILFVILLFLITNNCFHIPRYSLIYCFAFVWLFLLIFLKRKGTFAGLYSWFLGGLILFSYSFLDENSRSFKYLILISLVMALFLSSFEVFTDLHFPRSRFVLNEVYSKTYYGLGIPAYYFTNENDFSAFLVTVFFLVRSVSNGKKVVYDIFVLPFVVILLFLAGARLCMLAVFIYYSYLILQKFNRKIRFFVVSFIFLFIVYLTLKKVLPMIISLRNASSNSSIIVRINLLLEALNTIFIKKQVFGLGPASFPTIITENSGTSMVVDPHNWFMELGIEAGLLFLVIYLIFIFLYLKKEQNNKYKALFLVFLICNFCSSRFSGILWNWFFLSFFIKRFYTINLTYVRCKECLTLR